jgi:hypothetical protein
MAAKVAFSKPKFFEPDNQNDSTNSVETIDTVSISSSSSDDDMSYSVNTVEDVAPCAENLRRRHQQEPISNYTCVDHLHCDSGIEDETISSEPFFRRETMQPSKSHQCRILSCMSLSLTFTVWIVLHGSSFNDKSSKWGPSQDWRHFLQSSAPAILQSIQTSTVKKSYTIRLTASRPDLVEQSLEAHSRCPHVKEIQVDAKKMPFSSRFTSNEVQHNFKELKTEGVLLLQDDVMFTCDELDRGE